MLGLFSSIVMNKKYSICIIISFTYVVKNPNGNKSTLDQVMAWDI